VLTRQGQNDEFALRGPLAAGAGIVLALLCWQLWRFWPYLNDDAFITFRFSRALADGHGPYFNPGEHVEGYSNPLLMLLVSGWIFLAGPGAAALFAKGIGVASAVVSAAVSAALCRSAFPGQAGRFARLLGGVAAGGLVAASPSFAVNSVSGLETPLYAALLAAGVLFSAQERERASAAAFALATLTRPDAAAMFGVHWLARLAVEVAAGRLRERLRPLLESAFAVTAFVGIQLLVRHALYDGEWLPNTYYAKLGGFGRMDYWLDIYDGALAPVFGAGGLLLAAAGLASDRRAAARLLPAFATGLAAAHLPLLTGPDWMIGSRLVIPSLPLLAAACAGGWTALLSRSPLPVWAIGAVAAAVPASALLQEPLAADLKRQVEEARRDFSGCHAPLARWLSERSQRGEALAITDVGLIGYENPGLTIIDISGLTDRAIGKSPGGFLGKKYDPALVLDRRPRWIALSQGCARNEPPPASMASTEGRLVASRAFSREYGFVRAFGPPDQCQRRLYLYRRSEPSASP
jgi:hypothetical protein